MIYSTRRNGQIVMEALELLATPTTIAGIVRHISLRWRYDDPSEMIEIKSIVRNIVRKGVRNGFITKVGRNRYTTIGVMLKNEQRHVDENIQMMYHNYTK